MFKNFAHKFYVVGGSVRDEILGLPTMDTDYVFEGSKEEFEKNFPEAKLVGKDFPVYLLNGCEVALTRLEKSTGKGYGDFEVTAVGVPIKDDLFRRDFTINSISKNVVTNYVYDPYGGVQDLSKKLIRTVNVKAFEEDPVRILRAVRFATRFGFDIEQDTLNLMYESMENLQFVTKERIEKELFKTYTSKRVRPISFYFEMLEYMGALEYIFPVLHEMTKRYAGPEYSPHKNSTIFQHVMKAIDRAEANGGSYMVMLGTLFHDTGKTNTPDDIYAKRQHIGHELRGADINREIAKENRFSSDINEFIVIAARLHMMPHFITRMRAHKLMKFFKRIPKKYYKEFWEVVEADHPLSEEQKVVKNKLDKLLTMKYDVDKINKAKDKEEEVLKQMAEYYKGL